MPKIPVDQIPELVERHEHGESYRELGAKLNVSHMTVKRAIETYEPPLVPPALFQDFKLYDKARLKKGINYRFHHLKKGEEVQIIGFDKSDKTALVTVYRYQEAIDVPINALRKI